MANFSSYSEVLAKVREVVVDQFCLDSLEGLDNNAQFIRDLGADSLDVVQLVMVLEEQFEIRISEEYLSKIQTVKEVADIICKILQLEVKQ
jgi:acyl carrier protein